MKKCYIKNLVLNITNKCNMDCENCLRGNKNNSCMQDEVIESIFNQVVRVNNLEITGGEPTLAIDRLEKIILTIIDKNTKIEKLTITINGTMYSEKLLELLDKINNYINSDYINVQLFISFDEYHIKEMEKLNLLKEFKENLEKYKQSKFFCGYQSVNKRFFKEGNAVNLDPFFVTILKPMRSYITYIGNDDKFDRKNGLCVIGPIVAISTLGTITERDASIYNQEIKYNYGNILNNDLENVFLHRSVLVINSKRFEKDIDQEIKKYNHNK